jgi:thiamine biosynthesis lipoprotein
LSARGALALVVAAGLSAAVPGVPAASTAIVERRLQLMGTTCEIAVEAGDRRAAIAASEAVALALGAAERRLSTWSAESELARLNAAPADEWVDLSPLLRRDLEAARGCGLDTGGAFDAGIGALVEVWGLRTGGRAPLPEERVAALAAGGFAALDLQGARARRSRPGLRIEEGGFGKGAGLDDALAALRSIGSTTQDDAVLAARLDLGGQVAVLGAGPWRVALADPRDRRRPVIEVEIDHGSLSTSGNSERSSVVGGIAIGHLLDPRRGEPAPDYGSVTVWSASALRADCLSTGLYVLGPERALAWAAARRDVQALILEANGAKLRARATAGLRGRLRALAAELKIEYVDAVRGETETADPLIRPGPTPRPAAP